MIRTTKIAAALVIGVAGTLFFLDNLLNLEAAYGAVAGIVSGAEQPFYKIIGPTITSTWLTYVALFTIMAGELAVGVLGLLGAGRMLKERQGSAESFGAAKTAAIHAGILGMLVWYGLFIVVGEGYFGMWQSAAGTASTEGAFRYGTVCAVLMFFIATKDD